MSRWWIIALGYALTFPNSPSISHPWVSLSSEGAFSHKISSLWVFHVYQSTCCKWNSYSIWYRSGFAGLNCHFQHSDSMNIFQCIFLLLSVYFICLYYFISICTGHMYLMYSNSGILQMFPNCKKYWGNSF